MYASLYAFLQTIESFAVLCLLASLDCRRVLMSRNEVAPPCSLTNKPIIVENIERYGFCLTISIVHRIEFNVLFS